MSTAAAALPPVLLRAVQDSISAPIPMEELVEDAEAWERGVDDLARTDEEMASAIARLLTDVPLRERMYRYNVSVPPADLDWSAVIAKTEREYRRAMGRETVSPARPAARVA